MNKLGTTFFLDDSDCRGLTSFCNSSFKMIINSELIGELLEVSPVLSIRGMNPNFLSYLSKRKTSIAIHTSEPPVTTQVLRNKIQNFCSRHRRLCDIIHTIQKFCKGTIVGRNNSCFSTSGWSSCIFSPFTCFSEEWKNIGGIISNKSGFNPTSGVFERHMPICPNESEKIGIDRIHLFRYNKGRWINIPFVKRFVQFALHNVGAVLVCKAKTHCLGICYNGTERTIKFSRTISNTKGLVVLTNEIKFGVS